MSCFIRRTVVSLRWNIHVHAGMQIRQRSGQKLHEIAVGIPAKKERQLFVEHQWNSAIIWGVSKIKFNQHV